MSAPEFAINTVDPIVRSLLPGYLQRREEEIERIDTWRASGQFAEIRTAGHNLAGSGGAYGLPELSQIGRALEQAGQDADPDAVAVQLEAMRRYLAQVRAELD